MIWPPFRLLDRNSYNYFVAFLENLDTKILFWNCMTFRKLLMYLKCSHAFSRTFLISISRPETENKNLWTLADYTGTSSSSSSSFFTCRQTSTSSCVVPQRANLFYCGKGGLHGFLFDSFGYRITPFISNWRVTVMLKTEQTQKIKKWRSNLYE